MQPVYARVYDAVMDAIRSHQWQEGECIWSETEICQRFSVSRITAMRALNDLERTGLVRREKGIGTILLSSSIGKSREDAVHIISESEPHVYAPLAVDILRHLQSRSIPVSYYSESMLNSPVAWNQFLALSRGALILEGRAIDEVIDPYLAKSWNSFQTIIKVLCRSRPQVYPFKAVTMDARDIGRLQARHAIEQGYRPLVLYSYLSFTQGDASWTAHFSGMEEACREEGMPLVIRNEWDVGMSESQLAKQARSVVKAAGKGGAILCDSDHRASFLIRAISDLGWELGRDIGLVGCYDTPWARTLGLTSVAMPSEDILAAVDRLLENPRLSDQTVIPRLVARQSTKRES